MPVKKVGSEKAHEGERVGDLVEGRIGPDPGQDADRQRDQQRQDLRRADHEERRRHAVEDEPADVDAAREREAPVAVGHRGEPVQVAEQIGSSRPNFARRASLTSGGMFGFEASSPNGSPGAKASTVNRMRLIPSRLGIATRRRRSR